MLRIQTILQHFYKLLMWQILTSSNMDLSLTSQFLVTITIWKMLKLRKLRNQISLVNGALKAFVPF